MWNFCNILFKGFSVESSTVGKIRFDDSIDEYLIITRHNIIGIYSYKKGGLDLKKEIELFANVKFIKRIPSNSPQISDTFFCLADDLSYAFCSLDDGVLKSKGDGEINLPSSALLEIDCIKVIADTDHAFYTSNYSFAGTKYVAVHAYKEILNVFPFKYLPSGEINPDKPFILRLSQENILDIIPIEPKHYKSPKHALGILYVDKTTSNFQALEFNIPSEEFTKKILWDIPNIKETNVYKTAELSDGSLLIFSEGCISIYQNGTKSAANSALIGGRTEVLERVPNGQDFFILGDTKEGNIYLLSRSLKNNDEVSPFKFFTKSNQNELFSKYLGSCSIPNCITYLSNSCFFLGSITGDSLLVKVTDTLNQDNRQMPFLELQDSFYNLGAISDLRLKRSTNSDLNSNYSVLTTSYEKRKNQLNILQSGISLKLEGQIQIPFLKNLFTVDFSASGYTMTVLTTTLNTITLKIPVDGTPITTLNIQNFVYDRPAILVSRVASNNFVQVLPDEIILFSLSEMSNETFNLCDKKSQADFGGHILFADCFGDKLYVMTNSQALIIYTIRDGSLQDVITKNINFRPSCFSVGVDHIIMGSWGSDEVTFYDKESLEEVGNLQLKVSGTKSLKTSNLGSPGTNYLFVGFMDGSLKVINYSYMKGQGQDHSITSLDEYSYFLGTTSIVLREIVYNGRPSMFAGCDTPSLIYLNKDNNLVSVNIHGHEIKNIEMVNVLNEKYFAFITENSFSLALCDSDDKIHVKSLPIDCESEILFSISIDEYNLLILAINAENHSAINLYDINSYDVIKTIALDDREITSIALYTMNDFKGIVVGVNWIDRDEGQILTFEVHPNGLSKIQELSFEREVFYMSNFMENYIVVALSSFVKIFKITKEEGTESTFHKREVYYLQEIYTKSSFALPCYLDTYNNYILIVDHIKGLFLYLYNEEDNKLALIGQSVTNALNNQIGLIIDENSFILNKEGSLQVMRRNRHGETEGDRLIFQPKASINLGEEIYSIKKGSKVLTLPIKASQYLNNIPVDYSIFGTMKGAIGLVAFLPETVYNLLYDLQAAILNDITPGFGSNYTKWRNYKDKMNNEVHEFRGFVDGEVLKRVLNYPLQKLEKILNNMSSLDKPAPNQLFYLIETLTHKMLN